MVPINTDPSGPTTTLGRTRGNPHEFVGKAIVVYLDLLGFSAFMREMWDTVRPQEAVAVFRDILEYVRNLKAGNPFVIRNEAGEFCLQHQSFALSDSIYVAVALPPECGEFDFATSYLYLYTNITYAIRNLIQRGFLARGVLEWGDSWWCGHDVMGPALISAVRQEKGKIGDGVVVIGSGVRNEMRRLLGLGPPNADPGCHVAMSTMMVRGEGDIVISPYGFDRERPHIIGEIADCLCNLRAKAPDHVASKYDWLIKTLRRDREDRKPEPVDL